MAAAILPFLPMIAGAGSSILGGLLGHGAESGQKETLLQFAKILEDLGKTGVSRMEGPALDSQIAFKNILNQGGYSPESLNIFNQLLGQAQDSRNLFYNTPLDDQISQIMGQFTTPDQVMQLLGSGGQTADTRSLFNNLVGSEPSGLKKANDVGDYILSHSGRNAAIDNFSNIGQSIAGAGGFTPDLSNAASLAMQIAQGGGRTPESSAAMQTILGLLQGGGETPTTQGLEQKGLQIANKEPIMPLGMALSLARDEAANATKQAAEAGLRRAHARGGDAVVSTGLANDEYKNFADLASANEAQALRDTLNKQEGLGLQQQGLGFSGANDAAKTASSRLAAAIGGASDLNKTQGDIQNSALGLIGSLTNAATNRGGTFGNLGMNAEELATKNLGLGADMTNLFANNLLNRANTGNSLLNTEFGNLFKSSDVNSDYLKNALGAYLQGQNLNQNRGVNFANNVGQLLSNAGNISQQALVNYMNGGQGSLSNADLWSKLAQLGYGGMAGLIGQVPQVGGGLGNTLLQGGTGLLWSTLKNGGFGGGGSKTGGGAGPGDWGDW